MSEDKNAEKKPRLFYFEEGVYSFCPVPDSFRPEEIGLSLEDMEENNVVNVTFIRVDMTDDDFENLPEI